MCPHIYRTLLPFVGVINRKLKDLTFQSNNIKPIRKIRFRTFGSQCSKCLTIYKNNIIIKLYNDPLLYARSSNFDMLT